MSSSTSELATLESTDASRLLTLIPWALMAVGAVMVAYGVLADVVIASSTPGIGLGQAVLVLAGYATVATGFELSTAEGRTWLLDWRRLLGADLLEQAGRLAIASTQIVLLLWVIQSFRLVGPEFHHTLMPLATAGFLLHALLPIRQRLGFFVVLSLAGIILVFGLADGLWLIAVGLGLIALCHLPVPFKARVAGVAMAGAVLALGRGAWFPVPFSTTVWPILGSMFMFRLILYLVDQRQHQEAVSWKRACAYFFLLPNVTFPLFPVVDYATFRRTYYDQASWRIYQRGIQWMVRGVLHLLLYRLIYQHVLLGPEEVTSFAELSRYMVATFLLYLRVSGYFHLIVGMLHLFGFRLPETHQWFFVASSFTDFWRRINIYWKDFMMKVVYYPTFFRARRFATTARIVTATLAVFFATWLLHAYQWYWLLGTALLSWPDVLFWFVLALLLVANSLHEIRRGRTRVLDAVSWNPRAALRRAVTTTGVFVTICVLWSLWSSESLGEWLAIWLAAGRGGFVGGIADLVIVGAVLAAVLATAVIGLAERAQWSIRAASVTATVGLLLLVALGNPASSSWLSPLWQEHLRDLRAGELSRRDLERLQRGYYENLVTANRTDYLRLGNAAERPAEWRAIHQTEAVRRTGDFLWFELPPLVAANVNGTVFRTNRWGMRSRDYALLPVERTYRIAVLGSSYVAGQGVNDNETFVSLVESRLHHATETGQTDRVELLNFAVPDYNPLHQVRLMEARVPQFQPHAVLLISHPIDYQKLASHLARLVVNDIDLEYEFLRDRVQQAGVTHELTAEEAEHRLEPFRDDLLRWAYDRIVSEAHARGIPAIWVSITTPGMDDRELTAHMASTARTAGFRVLDLGLVYAGHDLSVLYWTPWDRHPNALGHRLIADALERALQPWLDAATRAEVTSASQPR